MHTDGEDGRKKAQNAQRELRLDLYEYQSWNYIKSSWCN